MFYAYLNSIFLEYKLERIKATMHGGNLDFDIIDNLLSLYKLKSL